MNFRQLNPEAVIEIHDAILNPGELTGLAGDKSLTSALARVENRIAYGMISDVAELAAAYAEAISQGHCFNDGNKRTAYECMIVCLYLNGVRIEHDTPEIGDKIIALAQGKLFADQLADWIRSKI